MSRDKKIIRAYFDGDSKNERENRNIISLLTRLNCTVVQTVMGTDLGFTLNPESVKSNINVFTNKIKDINNVDIFVCEVSNPSFSLFFQISEAINRDKPTLALYKEGAILPEEWLTEKYDFFLIKKYNESNLEEVLQDFIEYTSLKALTSRFTLRLNKDLLNYIDTLKPLLNCKSRNDVILTLLKNTRESKPIF